MSQLLLDQVDAQGDILATDRPLYVSGNVWYVHFGTGVDTNTGKSLQRPLKTISQALTNAANGDIVYLLDGHAESLTTNFTFTKSITWIGCGTDADAEPTVTFTTSSSGKLSLAGDMSEFRNIKVVVGDGASGFAVGGLNVLIRGCVVECGDGANYGITVSGVDETLRIENTVVRSTGTDTDNLPGYGIDLTDGSAGGVENIWLTDVTVDGGTVGFTGGIGITGHGGVPTTVHFRAQKLSLLNGADLDFTVGSAPTHYWIQIDERSGGAQLRGLTGQFLPNGLGETTGDVLATDGPLYVSGDVWYVHSTGTDAASPAGQERSAPLASVAGAKTNAVGGDIIVLMDGHTETLTSSHLSDQGVTFVGGGSAAGAPTVTFTTTGAGSFVLQDHSELRNVKFVAQGTSASGAVSLGTNSQLIGCRVECEGDASSFGVGVGGSPELTIIRDCVIVVTASVTPPGPGIGMSSAGAESMLVYNTVLDGGMVGFASGVAMDGSGGSPSTQHMRLERMSLLRGADLDFGLSVPSNYWIQPTTVTGGAAVRTE